MLNLHRLHAENTIKVVKATSKQTTARGTKTTHEALTKRLYHIYSRYNFCEFWIFNSSQIAPFQAKGARPSPVPRWDRFNVLAIILYVKIIQQQVHAKRDQGEFEVLDDRNYFTGCISLGENVRVFWDWQIADFSASILPGKQIERCCYRGWNIILYYEVGIKYLIIVVNCDEINNWALRQCRIIFNDVVCPFVV